MLLAINQIKVAERIRKEFGNIEELANDIKENGLINPPVVTPEHELIAGERRLRACKYLNYQQIEVRVMSVRDYEHKLKIEIGENEHRKEFTFSERMVWARELERIESAKARRRMSEGGKGRENLPTLKSERARDIVAEKIGIGSGKQYEKAKFIAEHADSSTIAKLDNEETSIHKAYTELKT
ncbi:TPA: ParB N-terminal domain-containing protein, partial [Bacillus cereus]